MSVTENSNPIEEIMADMSNLHRDLNKDQIAVTADEKQGMIVFDRCKGVILDLITEQDCNVRVIELSLFHFFHLMFARQVGLEDEADNMPMDVTVPMASTLMTKIANSIVDSGPDANSKKMAEMVAVLSDAMPDIVPQQSELTAIDADKTNRSVMAFINESVKEEQHPVLIRNALLYNWLRLSTINAKAPEELFQRIERNWPEAIEIFDKEYLAFLKIEADKNRK